MFGASRKYVLTAAISLLIGCIGTVGVSTLLPSAKQADVWYVYAPSGERVDFPSIAKIAKKPNGQYKVHSEPAIGAKPLDGTITLNWASAPITIPVPPNTPPVSPVISPTDPAPPPKPAPIPGNGMRVLFLEESGKRSPALQTLLRTPEVESYLNAKCVKGEDGKTAEWRAFDPDYTDESMALVPELWRKAYSVAKRDSSAAGKLPWIAVSDGTKGESIPLVMPDAAAGITADQAQASLMATLKKYGG